MRKPHLREEILKILLELGKPATINEIGKRVPLERHTLSKYLMMMRKEGVLEYEAVGRAKVWRVNKAPLDSIFDAGPASMGGFAEKVLGLLIENIPAGVLVMDSSYRINFMNDTLRHMYGEPKRKIFYEFILGENNPLSLGAIRDVVHGDIDYAEKDLVDKDGNVLNIRASSIKNPDGSISTILFVDDITYQQKVEERLRRSEELYRTLVETSQDGTFLMDLGMNMTFVSNRMLEILGYSYADEILGRPLSDFIVDEEHLRMRRRITRLLNRGSQPPIRCTFVRKDGGFLPIEITTTIVRDPDGSPRSILTAARDRSEREDNDKFFWRVAELCNAAIFYWDENSLRLTFSEKFERLHGGSLSGLDDLARRVESDVPLNELFADAVGAQEDISLTYLCCGKKLYMEAISSPENCLKGMVIPLDEEDGPAEGRPSRQS